MICPGRNLPPLLEWLDGRVPDEASPPTVGRLLSETVFFGVDVGWPHDGQNLASEGMGLEQVKQVIMDILNQVVNSGFPEEYLF